MYTCIMIPHELNLVVGAHPDPRNVLETDVSLWCKVHILPGTVFCSDQGGLIVDKLEVYSVLPDDDIRRRFGCYDVITEIDGQPVRHCNWVRFAKLSDDPAEFNVIGSRVKGQSFYTVTKFLKPHDKIVVFLRSDDSEDSAETVGIPERNSTPLGRRWKPSWFAPPLPPRPYSGVSNDDNDHNNSTSESVVVDRTLESGREGGGDSSDQEDVDVESVDEREASETQSERLEADSRAEKQEEGHGREEAGAVGEDNDGDGGVEDNGGGGGVVEAETGDGQGDNSGIKQEAGEAEQLEDRSISAQENGHLHNTLEAGARSDNPEALSDSTGDKPRARNSSAGSSGTHDDSKEVHYSLESDQSSPTEHRAPSAELSVSGPCLVTSPKLIAPEPTEVAPLRRARERTWWPCEMCPKKFDRPSLLKRHVRTHTGEKPHACDVCGKAFSTSSSLNTHRRIHSGEKPHQCQVCGKRFTASSNLYYHRMTHNKEKPHKCTMCCKSFPTPGDLRSHMYVHSGSWPLRCPVCNRGFSKQTNLKNHVHQHTGDKPHECPKCNKRFALHCNLKTHMKTHKVTSDRACTKCGATFKESAKKKTGGLCPPCFDLSPHPAPSPITPTGNNNYATKHTKDGTTTSSLRAKTSPTDFSIHKLTDHSPAGRPSSSMSSQSATSPPAPSPDRFPHPRGPASAIQMSPPSAMGSLAAQFYAHRPWPILMSGNTGTNSSPLLHDASPSSFLTPTSFPTSPMVARMMKDMTSLPPYAFYGGKATTPVSSFISPDVLSRGGGFLQPSQTTPPFPLTPLTPSQVTPSPAWKQRYEIS